jgi:tetratricopeptide (TPR) repeat protein
MRWCGLRGLVFGDSAGGRGRANASYGGAIWRARAELFGGGVWHLFTPTHLSPLEPFREAWSAGSPEKLHKTIGLALFGLMLGLGVLFQLRSKCERRGLLLLAALGLFVSVLPVLVGIRGLGQTPFADRYWYLAVLFFAVFVIELLRRACGWLPTAWAPFVPALALGAWYTALDSPAIATWQSPEAFYRTVVERHPDSPAGYWNLAELLRTRYARSLGNEGAGEVALLNEAFQLYEESGTLLARASQDPTIPRGELDHLRTGLGQAWCYLLQAEVDEYNDFDTPQRILEMLLEHVLRREAGNARAGGGRARLPLEEVLATLGTVKLRAGDTSGAAAEFRRALDINPNYTPALRNLAGVRFHEGEYALSSKLLSKALELEPNNAEFRNLYAESLFEEGWTERAIEVAEQLAELDPTSPTLETLRGLEALKGRDFRTALEHFDRALNHDPRASVALYQRGMALRELGETNQAIAALRRACDTDTESFAAHYNLAILLFESGAPATAEPPLMRAYKVGTGRSELPALRKALFDLDPDNPARMRQLAELDDSRHDASGALFWTERALEADPENGRSRHLKGRLLLDFKEPVLALPELVHATELLPNGYLPFLDLGRCYTELGKYDEARQAFGRARELVAAQVGPTGADASPESLQAFQAYKQQTLSEIESRLARLP